MAPGGDGADDPGGHNLSKIVAARGGMWRRGKGAEGLYAQTESGRKSRRPRHSWRRSRAVCYAMRKKAADEDESDRRGPHGSGATPTVWSVLVDAKWGPIGKSAVRVRLGAMLGWRGRSKWAEK